MKRQHWLVVLLTMMFAVAAIAQPSLQTLVTTGLSEPYGVAVDSKNNYYITDSVNNRIARYDTSSGALTNLAGVFGESGRNDGPGVFAHFFNPQGIVAARGGLVVADSGNHLIRFVAFDGTVTTLAGSTLGFQDGAGAAARFNGPAGLAADAAGNVYVADLVNNRIRKIDLANNVTTLAGTFSRPESIALDRATGTLYVADTGNHTIMRIAADGTVSLLAGSGSRFVSGTKDSLIAANALFNSPRGLLWVGGKVGLLVSDTGNSSVRRVYFNATFNTFSVETYVSSAAGLKSPVGMAIDNVGNFPLVDLAARKLYTIQVTTPQPPVIVPEIGIVILTTNIFGQLRTSLEPVINSTFNNDVKVAILSERGTDTFYTLDPDADFPEDVSSRNTPQPYENGLLDWPFSIVNPAVDGANVVVRAIGTQDGRRSSPIATARFQFKVANTVINGKNPGGFTMDNATVGAQLWYTTDGSAPTAGAPSRLYVPGSRLSIVDGNKDVVFKVRAFKPGYTPSAEIAKTFLFSDLENSSIGITRDFNAGVGSTIVVPVDVKLATGDSLRSLQFRVEITPENGAPQISTQFRYLHINTNDFIRLPVVSDVPPIVQSYTTNISTGVAISFISNTNLFLVPADNAAGNILANDIATVALLAVPVPATAQAGQTYNISVRFPSGTSDGRQTPVNLTTFADRKITIKNTAYTVGDSAVATWYNAGDFGNGNLNNNDVNNAFLASLGIFAPYSFTDVFDAMDAFPEDSSFAVGGDGQIRFLDWNVISERSLRLSGVNWSRTWAGGGVRNATGATLTSAASTPAESFSNASQLAWSRDGQVAARTVENATPGQSLSVPVYAKLGAGRHVKGLQFRASVTPEGDAPAITQRVRFISNPALPNPVSLQAVESRLPVNQTVGAWSLTENSFSTPIQGETLLGYVSFTLPESASKGQSYRVEFSNVDGSPDLRTQYDFESLPGNVWILTPALRPAEVISDEWKVKFFGSVNNPWSARNADPDGDGVSNEQEYRTGSKPTKLRLHDLDSDWRSSLTEGGFKLRWFAEDGQNYMVERSSDMKQWNRIATDVSGRGDVKEVTDSQATAATYFYRVRFQQ